MSREHKRPLVVIGVPESYTLEEAQEQQQLLREKYPEYRFLLFAGATFATVVPQHAEHFVEYAPLMPPGVR